VESNHQPSPCRGGALPTELRGRRESSEWGRGDSNSHMTGSRPAASAELGYAPELREQDSNLQHPGSEPGGLPVTPSRIEWVREDSNLRPQASHACALVRLSYEPVCDPRGECGARTRLGLATRTRFRDGRPSTRAYSPKARAPGLEPGPAVLETAMLPIAPHPCRARDGWRPSHSRS
jgi:hypothetical protein